MIKVIEGNTQVDLLFTNKDRLTGEIINGSFGCCDHEMDEFKILREEEKAASGRLQTLDFRHQELSLFKKLLGLIQ